MAELRYRPSASADIEEIYRFSVDRFGLAVADEYHDGLLDACRRLAEFPSLGPVAIGIRPPVRRFAFRSHQIYYDLEDDTVYVVRVLHHARDPMRALS